MLSFAMIPAELREEAGVIGEVIRPMGSLEFTSGKEPVRVEYFLARRTGTTRPAEQRETRWCTYAEAHELLSHDDAKALLAKAYFLLKAPGILRVTSDDP
jgi:hypothetical protein